MKVSVIRPSSDEEDEIIFRCHTLDIYFHNDTTYFTYKIIVNLNVQYINELVKDLYKLQ